MPRSRFACLALGITLFGMVLGGCLPPNFRVLSFLFLSFLLLGFSWINKRKARIRNIFFLASCLTCGFSYTGAWRISHTTTYRFGEAYHFSAILIQPPDVRTTSTLISVQPVTPIANRKSTILIHTTHYPVLKYGDQIMVTGVIEKPEAFNGFNYPLYLERNNTYGIIFTPKNIVLQRHDRGNIFLANLYALRSHLENSVQRVIPEPEASFLNGILLGSKQAIPSSVQDALRATGTSHIIAISGANITILLSIISRLLPLYRPRTKLVVGTGIAVFITLLTGASASVERGAMIAFLGSYILYKSRKVTPTPFILISIFLLIVGNPLLIVADPGFQLSFAAFAGLSYFGEPVKNTLKRAPPFLQPPEIVQSSLTETIAATIGTAFLSWKIFGQVSLLGLIVNPLILWLLPAITFLGLLIIVFGWIPGVTFLIKIPLWLLLHTVLTIIDRFSRVPFGVIHWNPSWLVIICVAISILVICSILQRICTSLPFLKRDLSPV